MTILNDLRAKGMSPKAVRARLTARYVLLQRGWTVAEINRAASGDYRVHFWDSERHWVLCGNSGARGMAVKDRADVTCRTCQRVLAAHTRKLIT